MRTISSKVSNEIYNLIAESSRHNGVTISDYIKQCVIKGRVSNRDDNLRKLYELNRIGNCLRDISTQCNISKTIDLVVLQQLKSLADDLQNF